MNDGDGDKIVCRTLAKCLADSCLNLSERCHNRQSSSEKPKQFTVHTISK